MKFPVFLQDSTPINLQVIPRRKHGVSLPYSRFINSFEPAVEYARKNN
ncbi:MAG: hypothetical protein FWD66_02015 [Paludibacter sp.]|nr:hypothetical protein [Paludibacter sp.]